MASAVLAPWPAVTAAEGMVLAMILAGTALRLDGALHPAATMAMILLAIMAVVATVQRERAGRAEGERDVVRAEAAALRAEAGRLREDVLTERERANVALARAAEAEARLAAGSPTVGGRLPTVRALKAWRAFLARQKRP
jgi:hypothetical protein